ncbi:hypothetical protein C8R44DRAFT_850611 [Mycena epipterygia]|nr:hypothetical protein C8R44DRAFT_850611 [Mycena epipterygia]
MNAGYDIGKRNHSRRPEGASIKPGAHGKGARGWRQAHTRPRGESVEWKGERPASKGRDRSRAGGWIPTIRTGENPVREEGQECRNVERVWGEGKKLDVGGRGRGEVEKGQGKISKISIMRDSDGQEVEEFELEGESSMKGRETVERRERGRMEAGEKALREITKEGKDVESCENDKGKERVWQRGRVRGRLEKGEKMNGGEDGRGWQKEEGRDVAAGKG